MSLNLKWKCGVIFRIDDVLIVISAITWLNIYGIPFLCQPITSYLNCEIQSTRIKFNFLSGAAFQMAGSTVTKFSLHVREVTGFKSRQDLINVVITKSPVSVTIISRWDLNWWYFLCNSLLLIVTRLHQVP